MDIATQLSLEDYLATSYHPDCDYVDDHIEERNLGLLPHSKLQVILASYIHVRRKLWRVRALTEQRIRVAPLRIRIPDVCIVPANVTLPSLLSDPPLACAEILSEGDTLRSTSPRLRDYHELGVRNLWVFNLITFEAWIWTPKAVYPEASALTIPDTQVSIPLPELFAELSGSE